MIAVTFALPAESAEFVCRLRDKSRIDHKGIRTMRGTINHRAVEVLHTGVGEKTCRQRVEKFLQQQHYDCLISAGFAGALSNDLQIGDLLLAANFSTFNLSARRSLLSSLPVHVADLLTVPALIDSSEARSKLARTSGAAAADMETEFIARACAKHGMPLLSLRVISDTPREIFPAPANVVFDIERQQTRMLKLANYFLTHPSRVPRLVRFARQIARARKILADALISLVNKL
jgi:adenosylhomocysteine nucleosidase